MNLSQRQQQILQRVQQQGFVSIDDLVASFNVTPQTVRRDINALCDLGVLRRFHGGAGLPSSVENIAYPARQILNLEEKQRIAQLVAQHIPDKSSLFINLGTTTEEVAKALADHTGLRVITNNLNVATLLSDKPGFEVIITGGLVRHRDRGIVGEATVDFIKQFKVDFGVIGISGIDLDGTLLDFDYREVRVSQAIIANSRNVLLVADHSKFSRSAMVRLGHISEVNMLFTDDSPPESMDAVLAAAEVQVLIANAGNAAASPHNR
ncbi:MAG TPA: DeoR/GlpR family transcriptional regulator [Candidatus Competibacteraceae bacterium]|nr:DeoR/GlpR family transcriptional regulator [Candidatus Competibacteraceae bacterium]HRZ06605.1 DeoR/GlpR family transcriptional regulator [Candidatus Competibacteraceae bacterium]HSA46709.1 DeoR/GlpR family transcriptional regulator [Candidatus Competibacteraceae bacterium]